MRIICPVCKGYKGVRTSPLPPVLVPTGLVVHAVRYGRGNAVITHHCASIVETPRWCRIHQSHESVNWRPPNHLANVTGLLIYNAITNPCPHNLKIDYDLA